MIASFARGNQPFHQSRKQSAFSAASSRSTITTREPAANIASVLANPMPDAAPVTTATLPSNSLAIGLAVLIAPGLWLASPKNGNISNVGRRLSAISLPSCSNWEYRDGQQNSQKAAIGGHLSDSKVQLANSCVR